VCRRTLDARFGGAKRDNLLDEQRFAILAIDLRTFRDEQVRVDQEFNRP
jgi:hypothetical protein